MEAFWQLLTFCVTSRHLWILTAIVNSQIIIFSRFDSIKLNRIVCFRCAIFFRDWSWPHYFTPDRNYWTKGTLVDTDGFRYGHRVHLLLRLSGVSVNICVLVFHFRALYWTSIFYKMHELLIKSNGAIRHLTPYFLFHRSNFQSEEQIRSGSVRHKGAQSRTEKGSRKKEVRMEQVAPAVPCYGLSADKPLRRLVFPPEQQNRSHNSSSFLYLLCTVLVSVILEVVHQRCNCNWLSYHATSKINITFCYMLISIGYFVSLNLNQQLVRA